MYGRNTGNLATIRIRQEFVLREFELSGMHCIYLNVIHIFIIHIFCICSTCIYMYVCRRGVSGVVTGGRKPFCICFNLGFFIFLLF